MLTNISKTEIQQRMRSFLHGLVQRPFIFTNNKSEPLGLKCRYVKFDVVILKGKLRYSGLESSRKCG